MGMKQQDHFFDITDISQRIKVQEPYFAFQQLQLKGESLVGTFASEQPLIHETGLITAGELGRHLAILGSCTAVALHNGPEGYYLATKAHFVRNRSQHTVVDGLFHASAHVLNMDKRSLTISAKAWHKEPVAELKCEYTILSPALFQRNFQRYAKENVPLAQTSPYQHPIPTYGLTFHNEKLDALAGPLTPEQCAGHFYGYPCWPVAIISQTAFQVTGELLTRQYGAGTRFCVQETKLSADKLIGADSVLKFSIEITDAPEGSSLIDSTVSVYHDEELVAQLINTLELVLPEPPIR